MDKKIDILIIANKQVFPAIDGGAFAIKNLASILSDQNYCVDMVCISKNNNVRFCKKSTESNHYKRIKQIVFVKNMKFNIINFLTSITKHKSYQASRFYEAKIRDYIQTLINQKKYKIIIFESVFTTIYLDKLKIPKKTKTILRAHNVEHKIWMDLANNNQNYIKKILFRLLAKQIKKIEKNIPKNIDHIFTLSINDEKYFSELFPNKTHTIPVTFKINTEKYKKIKNSIFHLGAMDWKPNKEGVSWFLEKVKPLINEPTQIYIAGKNMPTHYLSQKNKNIIIEGTVKDAHKYIKNKEILFVPLLSGSGIRIKILEAMALGIPVISTSQGAQGIPYLHNHNILIANKPSDFAHGISRLVKNKNLAHKIGNNGKKLISQYFSKKHVVSKWKKIIK